MAYFYMGFHPRYVWQDGKIGTKSVYQGRALVPSEDMKVWTGLFLDLIFVALIAQLTKVLTICEASFSAIGYCYGILSFFYMSRVQLDEYCIRFAQDDVFHRIIFFIYILSILFMCSFVGMSYDTGSHRLLSSSTGSSNYTCSVSQDFYSRFGYALYVNRLTLMSLYISTFFFDKTGKSWQQFPFRVVCGCVVIGLYAISDQVISHSNSKIIALIVLAETDNIFVFVMILLRMFYNISMYILHYPMPYLHMQERNGVFVLVILGEVIIAFISATNGTFTNQSIQNTFFGFLLIFSLATTYFDTVQRMEGEMHAVRRSAIAGFTHTFIMHKNLGYFLLLISAAIVSGDGIKGTPYLCYGTSGASLCMLVGKKMHKGFTYHMGTMYRLAHFGSSLLVVGGHLATQSYLSFENSLIVHSLLAVTTVIIDVVYTLVVHLLQPKKQEDPIEPHRYDMHNPPTAYDDVSGDDEATVDIGIDIVHKVRQNLLVSLVDSNEEDIGDAPRGLAHSGNLSAIAAERAALKESLHHQDHPDDEV